MVADEEVIDLPPRELPTETSDADDVSVGAFSSSSRISEVQLEELARAEARARAARAHATRLRAQAEAAASSDEADRSDGEDKDDERDVSATQGEALAESPSARRWRRPRRTTAIAAAAILVVCASLTASGLMVWYHRVAGVHRQRAAEFTDEARNAVLTLMSIDADKAREEMQRFADETTGPFKVGILMGAEDLVKAVEQSKAASKGTVKAVGLESMTTDSAIVLVAVKSEVTKPGQAKPELLSSRIIVTVERDAGQLKVSRIEFVP